jgi:hypothetical protein
MMYNSPPTQTPTLNRFSSIFTSCVSPRSHGKFYNIPPVAETFCCTLGDRSHVSGGGFWHMRRDRKQQCRFPASYAGNRLRYLFISYFCYYQYMPTVFYCRVEFPQTCSFSVPLLSSHFRAEILDGDKSLVIKSVVASDEGTYICEAHNSVGQISSKAQLIVNCKYIDRLMMFRETPLVI